MDALEGSFQDYGRRVRESSGDEVDYERYFAYLVFHTPFAGITFQAHRTLSNLGREVKRKKAELQESFKSRVFPSLRYSQRLGSTYGASNYAGLCSVVAGAERLDPGGRIGLFAYGSGAIGEFYSGLIGPEARELVGAMGIDAALDARREVSVEEYETIEKAREAAVESANVQPDFGILDGWYDTFYAGKGYLVLRGVKDFYRTYEWS